MNPQDSQFGGYAGQLREDGIAQAMPLQALEQGVTPATFANLQAINGMMPKIKDIFVRDTRVFANPLEGLITVFDERYGAGMEQVAVKYGAYNEQQDGSCMPRGVPDMVSQLDLENFAYSVDIAIPDRMIDKAVLDDGQRGSVVSALMEAPLKTIASLRYRAWVQLLSNVIDGTRSISSSNAYNGATTKSGSATVTYNPTITGYAGLVETREEVLPQVQAGEQYVMPSAKAALDICNRLKSIAADFAFESDAFNRLGVQTYTSAAPILVAERKVLDAMDTVFAEANVSGNGSAYGYAGFPSVSARDYLRSFVGQIVEIDSFASLPTNADYTGQAVHFVLMDRDALIEVRKHQSVEGQRCAKRRETGYNWQGESIFSIWRGVNSAALLFPSE